MEKIFLREEGEGKCILLIHGFPFNAAIWDQFTPYLSDKFKVITVDLPGFGKSSTLEFPFTIEDVAKQITKELNDRTLSNVVVIGHSLGGYVALAMVAQQPELFSGLGLFHSTAYADTKEKRESRTKVIDFIEKNGVEAFTSNFVNPLFANPNHPRIQEIRAMNLKASEEAVVGYTMAMRDRPDQTGVLKSFDKPILFIGGQQDQVVPVQHLYEQAALTNSPFVVTLGDQAHMALVEDIKTTACVVENFVLKC